MEQVDLPPGTINLVMGPAAEIVNESMTNRICRKISFTSSTEVGKELVRNSAGQLKRLSLELGGHAPVIVFPDVDIEMVAKASVIGKFQTLNLIASDPDSQDPLTARSEE